MSPVDVTTVLRPSRDLRFRRIDSEAVVIRQRAGEVLVMNELAARLLDLADGRTSVGGWIDALAGEYDVERTTLERDVLAFAADLADEGMLERVPETAGAAGDRSDGV